MRRAVALAPLSLLLMAFQCHEAPPAIAWPTLPELSAETKKPCPPLPSLTGTLADLVTKDGDAAAEYARCSARHDTAVGAYEDARARLDAAKAASEKR